VLQDVLARLGRTDQAVLPQVPEGERPSFHRFQGRGRSHSYSFKEYGNGAHLENGYPVLSKIGRIAVHWSRPVVGTIKTVTLSREAVRWHACFSCAQVPAQPLLLTGQETGSDLSVRMFLMTADGKHVESSSHYRKAEKRLARRQPGQ